MGNLLNHSGRIYLLLLYTVIILRYPIGKYEQEIAAVLEHYEEDLEFFKSLLQQNSVNYFINNNDRKDFNLIISSNNCEELLNEISFTDDFVGSLNNLFGVKNVRYGEISAKSTNKNELDSNLKIVIKYLSTKEKFQYILNELVIKDENSNFNDIQRKLKKLFFHKQRIDGYQFCPEKEIENFLSDKMKMNFSSFTQLNSIRKEEYNLILWAYLIINPLPVILPKLNEYKFPVPKFYGSCGFTIIQSYDGKPLNTFYSTNMDFKEKLEISKQLIEAAVKFTEGLENAYRFYLTDLTPDNIVYNENTKLISFVDLDNIIIVANDSSIGENNKNNDWDSIHKHDVIDCKGCFGYVPEEICSHHKSDINLYVTCQLLRSDLYNDETKGFLHPIPNEINTHFPQFEKLLNECVTCSDEENCINRFNSASNLLKTIENMILWYKEGV